MSLARHTVSGLAAYGLPLLAALIVLPLYLNLLGAPRYGVFVLVLALSNYATFLDLGAGKALAFFLARGEAADTPAPRALYSSGLAFCLTSTLLPSLAAIAAAPWIAGFVPAVPEQTTGEVIRAIGFAVATVPVIVLVNYLTGAYQGLRLFHRLSAMLAAGGVALQVAPLLACLALGARLDIALAAVLLMRGATAAALAAGLHGRLGTVQGSAVSFPAVRKLIAFGRWPASLNLLTAVLSTGDRLVISAMAGAAAVAAYAIPFDLASRLMVIAGSFANTLFPTLASDGEAIAGRIRRAGEAVLGLLTPITLVVIMGMHPFLTLWVGPAVAGEAKLVGEIVICGVWLTAINALVQSRLLAEERSHWLTLSYAAQLLPYFAAVYFATRAWGLIGCAAMWSLRCAAEAAFMLRMTGDGIALARPLLCHGALLVLALALVIATPALAAHAVSLAVLLPVSLWLSHRQIALVAARLLGR